MRGVLSEGEKSVVNRWFAMFLVIVMSVVCLVGCVANADVSPTDGLSGRAEDIDAAEEEAVTETVSTEEVVGTEAVSTEGTVVEEAVGTEKDVMEETAVSEITSEEKTEEKHEEASESVVVPQSSGGYSSPFVGVYEYTTPENIDDNIFMDSLIYTGYNIEKHIEDGMMWEYLLAAKKRDRGWLSNITYNGGSTGYETTEEGLPNISFFEKHGLVCASYVTYVYFNYLPNVVGIDTSELTKPEKSYNANDWYIAAKDWVEQGLSETIDFDAALKGGFIKFDPAEEIPIGSILAFCDSRNKSDYCSHVVIYAGYKNGYHWVYHVGNDNGPEFCSVERMHFGPDPQWPIAIITPPDMVLEDME